MCLVLLLRDVHPDAPLVIAANRDEFLARASSGPRFLPVAGGVRAVGGVDEVAHGTWMGLTDQGFVVGVTNQRPSGAALPTGLKSRGQLVLDVLATGSVAAARRHLAGVDARTYSPFNLLFGDAREVVVAYGRLAAAQLTYESVPPGVHVLPNDRLDSPELPKVGRARDLLEALPISRLSLEELAPALAGVLSDHVKPPGTTLVEPVPGAPPPEFLRELQAICIHTPTYGTRSSSVIALPAPTATDPRPRYWFASGRPCETKLAEVLLLRP